jgi:DNA replication and repair protein RecF
VRILGITSENFRNLEVPHAEFHPHLNIVTGGNGQGKTNLLEALAFFKFGRSFRTRRDQEVIRFGAQFCRVSVDVKYEDGARRRFTTAVATGGEKRVKMDGEELGKLSDLVGLYPVVLFGPQDIQIVGGFPDERRRFLDMAGSMVDAEYLELLKRYKRVLAQRNKLLRMHSPPEEVRAWNPELVSTGSRLVEKRIRMTASLAELSKRWSEAIYGGKIEVSYKSSVTMRGEGMAGDYEETLAATEDEESRRGTTLFGPHRDDLLVTIDGKDARKYGSQGQKRIASLLLRLAEMHYLEKGLGEPCVLLLDDVFSELDEERSTRLMRALTDSRQVFMTSPRPPDPHASAGMRLFRMEGGRLAV